MSDSDSENECPGDLAKAAQTGNAATVSHLIHDGYSVNLQNSKGQTPLHEAVKAGHTECVRVILEQDCCIVNCRDYVDGSTPLLLACTGKPEIAQLLLEHGANTMICNNNEQYPLHIAALNGQVAIMKLLFNYGADANSGDPASNTPLMSVIRQYAYSSQLVGYKTYSLEPVEVLLINGANLQHCNANGFTPLCMAVSVEWYDCVKLLLETGADVNVRHFKTSHTPLMMAVEAASLGIVRVLLQYGADANMATDGLLPIHTALSSRFARFCPSIVEEVFDSTSKDALLENIKKWSKRMPVSLPILALESEQFNNFLMIMKRDLGSVIEQTECPFWMEMMPLLNTTHGMRSYELISPLSYLLSKKILHPSSEIAFQIMLKRGASPNAKGPNYVPPMIALILTEPFERKDADKSSLQQRKNVFFRDLMKHGCNIDFCTNEYGIPDTLLAITTHSLCSRSRHLLPSIFQYCFSHSTNDIAIWLAQRKVKVSAEVIHFLFSHSTLTRDKMHNIWHKMRRCSCEHCKPFHCKVGHMLAHGQICSLQYLCCATVRKLLWKNTQCSRAAMVTLQGLELPQTIKYYIAPQL